MIENSQAVIDAFNMFQDQYSQVDKLWNYFGVISVAVAGFTIGSEKASRSIWEPLAIIFGYLIFCIGNYQSLINGHTFLYSLATKYNELAKPAGLDTLIIHRPERVTEFYFAVVITFSLAIIVVSWSRLKSHNKGRKQIANSVT
ncbi:hypothetical protein [Microbulbifer aggregans]|uniref:hypothetical protein n=1 Tax=Microbulbifer aggregans TaxID=1769779 RepID=UPI001CFE88F4|nr:hypothetical protein [Microbulbifer aggregans]